MRDGREFALARRHISINLLGEVKCSGAEDDPSGFIQVLLPIAMQLFHPTDGDGSLDVYTDEARTQLTNASFAHVAGACDGLELEFGAPEEAKDQYTVVLGEPRAIMPRLATFASIGDQPRPRREWRGFGEGLLEELDDVCIPPRDARNQRR